MVGIEDGGSEQRVALGERDGNTETGIAVCEIGGAVERIDVPAKFGSGVLTGAFFCSDGMAGEILVETTNDELLGALVGLGDEVDFVAFVANVQRAGEFLHEDLAGFLSDFDDGLQIALGHGKNCRGVCKL